MKVLLYNFKKKLNSTKTPSGTGSEVGIEKDLKVVDGVNILRPAFLMNTSSLVGAEHKFIYNYCYVPLWSRYYFIDSVAVASPHSVISCSIDLCGTYANAIKQSTQRVERAGGFNENITGNMLSSVINSSIPDGLAFSETGVTSGYGASTLQYNNSNVSWKNSYSTGCYIISVSGEAGSTTQGSNVLYALNPSNFVSVCNYLFNGISWMGVTDISEALQKAILNPLQYITSARWYPFKYEDVEGTAVSKIKVGYWSISTTAKRLDASASIDFSTMTQIPRSNESNVAEYFYLQSEPYTKSYYTFRPFCTSFELPMSTLSGCLYLKSTVKIDFTSGYGNLKVDGYIGLNEETPNVRNIININTNYGINVPISQQTNSLPSNEQLVMSVVGGVAEGVKTLGGV